MVRGGGWLLLLRVIERGLGVARIVVLVRLLAPDQFGLMAVGLMAMSLTRQFSSTGFRQALVQKQGDVHDYLGTAWTVNFLRDLVLAASMVAAAPLVAGFFDAPEARLLLQVLAVSWLLSGLRNIGMVYIQRELAFRRFFVYQLAARSTEMVVSITAAVVWMNVWALVFGLLASNLVELVLSYIIAPRPSRIRLNIRQARELFRFGRWVLGAQAVSFMVSQLDRIVIGKVAGVATLGLYQIAYHIATLMSDELGKVIYRTAFPTYSRLQSQGDQVRLGFLKLTQASSLVVIPVAVGMILLAEGLTQHVLGDRWISIVRTLQILAVFTALQTSTRMAAPLFNGLGRPDLLTKTLAARLAILALLLYPFTRWWGMEGAASALVLSTLAVDPLVWVMVFRLSGVGILEVVRAVGPAFAGALTMTTLVVVAGRTVFESDALVGFVGLVFVAGLGYVSGLALWMLAFHWDPRELARLGPNVVADGALPGGDESGGPG